MLLLFPALSFSFFLSSTLFLCIHFSSLPANASGAVIHQISLRFLLRRSYTLYIASIHRLNFRFSLCGCPLERTIQELLVEKPSGAKSRAGHMNKTHKRIRPLDDEDEKEGSADSQTLIDITTRWNQQKGYRLYKILRGGAEAAASSWKVFVAAKLDDAEVASIIRSLEAPKHPHPRKSYRLLLNLSNWCVPGYDQMSLARFLSTRRFSGSTRPLEMRRSSEISTKTQLVMVEDWCWDKASRPTYVTLSLLQVKHDFANPW